MHLERHLTITGAKSEMLLRDMADWSKQKVLNYIKEGDIGEYIIISFFDGQYMLYMG
ncbi:hypothetical protein RhiirA1_222992 [Rhizophagus irregularis]|uniref:Uncharacterized protein n=1 Tax=Rhizophagus irregularis TaxID=588596 RepID=A0A2N0RLT2_9GLOM|nr:hypothetical protein RhiirA1_222992 [Rhizophagus irregularis]